MDNLDNSIIEQTRSDVEDETKEPPMYRVILYNDDFTPRAFAAQPR